VEYEKMARLISSSTTAVYKFVFVSFWMVISLTFIMSFIFSKIESWWSVFKDCLFLVLIGIPILILLLPLKEVAIEGKQLIVSNFVKKVRINASDIAGVKQRSCCGMYFYFVRIHLKIRTVFGNKISFIPKVYLSVMGNQHPIVSELKQLAGLGESADDHTGKKSETTRPGNPLESN